MTPLQREQVLKRLLEVATSDPDERVRSEALRLLLTFGERGKKLQEVLIQALSRSPQEATLGVEVLPQIADEGTWRRLMDVFEVEKDPTVQDRLSRILCKMPTTVWRDFVIGWVKSLNGGKSLPINCPHQQLRSAQLWFNGR